jgi:hypothetical protein
MFVQMNLFENDRELKQAIQDYFSEFQKMAPIRRNEARYVGDNQEETTIRILDDEGPEAYEKDHSG